MSGRRAGPARRQASPFPDLPRLALPPTSRADAPLPEHFGGLDATELDTPDFRLIGAGVGQAARSGSAVFVYSPVNGVGKTYAVNAALQALADPSPIAHITLNKRCATTECLWTLLKAVTGIEPSGRSFELQARAEEVLGELFRLLIIDECQDLSYDAMRVIRTLWDNPRTCFGLVLIGGPSALKRFEIEGALLSRCRRVPVWELTREELHGWMPRLHPLLADADVETLDMIRDFGCGGRLRAWAQFVGACKEASAISGASGLDADLVEQAFTLVEGRPEPVEVEEVGDGL